jgi:hypothetical protein
MSKAAEAHARHINRLIAKGVEFQIGLRATGQPIGPGKVEEEMEPDPSLVDDDRPMVPSGLYRMAQPAHVQPPGNKNAAPVAVIVPIVFHVEDVILVIEPIINKDGQSAIVTPGNGSGGKTAGGIHILGG